MLEVILFKLSYLHLSYTHDVGPIPMPMGPIPIPMGHSIHYLQVLEGVQTLHLGYNMITDLGFLTSFIALQALNLSFNRIECREELNHFLHLKALSTLSIKGVCIAPSLC